MQKNRFLMIGSLAGMLAVMLGAFGAHGLEKILEPRMLQRFHTGVEYQFYHALALVLISILNKQINNNYIRFSGYAFLLGIVLFSGSLYAYVLTGLTAFVVLTPIGGVSFIAGWALLFFAATKFTYRH